MNRILIFVILCVGLFQSCTKQETITYQAQFKIDTELVDSFVKNSNTDAVKVNTGFWYSIDTLRNGIYPTFSDSVKISYSIKWIEPTSTNESDLKTVGYSASSTVLLSKAISGLQQALILFPAGSYGRIYLPSGLAFGSSEHSYPNDTPQINIPVNANLLYEIKLIGVKGTRFASDTTDIGNYLRANTIKSLKDVSGIRYTINNAGQTSSAKPTQEDSVIV